MLTQTQKNDILRLIEEEILRMGSAAQVAKKCVISETALSQLRKGVYAAKGDDIYSTIAVALGYDFGGGKWNIAETHDFRSVYMVLEDAKREALFIGISHKAGGGKTTPASVYLENNRTKGVYYLACKEWSGREFLAKLAIEVGADMPKGIARKNDLLEAIAIAFKGKTNIRPLLILDQANSLRPSALIALIHLYNELEDVLGCVILGTENLEQEIKRGVRFNKDGYDELDSRFGRNYLHLRGSSLEDTRKICAVNGIEEAETQLAIFNECNPVQHALEGGRTIKVIEDIRRIKRVIKRERIKLQVA
ncbi:ATP-binding protein [Paludibacter sp.]|uniref:ATP-binding protein n=1 Tax=Paludibacter sp. TaxID=1898105 RepID=UPI001353F664|nr:ATP-binding protein [Paludibacter sp.]MTK53323.1 ATP-binding protein [Paludibacter sp.]